MTPLPNNEVNKPLRIIASVISVTLYQGGREGGERGEGGREGERGEEGREGVKEGGRVDIKTHIIKY